MSRKAYITTVKEVLETRDPFPQLVKLTEGSKNVAEVMEKLAAANIPVCGPTILSTVRAEIAKGTGKSRVRKTSDIFRIATVKAGRGPDKAPRSRRTKAEMLEAATVPASA